MLTELTAMVKPEVGNKVYSNYLKRHPPFKPWKGMEGCAWFGYAGSPNAGSLIGKSVKVKVTIDMPSSVPVITKKDLVTRHNKIMQGKTYQAAEGQMWHEVGKRGLESQTGLLSVLVGESSFSATAGKYLLVSNKALQMIYMTDTQAQELKKQLDKDIDVLLLARQAENEQTHGKTVTVHYPAGLSKADNDLTKFEDDIIKKGPPAGQLKVEQKCIKSKGKKRSVWWIVSYDSYLNAKRDARRIYNQTVQVPETGTRHISVEFGEDGDRWKYKDHGKLLAESPPEYGSYVYPG
jgi:hypothetical protein